MIRKRRNPFWIPFFCCTLISGIILGFTFLYVFNDRSHELEGQYYQEKVENVLDDFDLQMKVFEKIALRISINNKYQPFQLAKHKYSENELLDDFTQYQQYSILTDELFIYYNNNKNLFHVMGNTIDMDVYMNKLTEDDGQKLMDRLSGLGVEQDILSCGKKIYILTPINIYDVEKKVKAVLVGVIDMDTLQTRFNIVSGGLDGSLALSKDEEIFYHDGSDIHQMDKRVYEAVDLERSLRLCYKPNIRLYFSLERFLMQIMLILTDVLLVTTIAGLFAKNTYKPIREISEKYRDENTSPDISGANDALEEIDNILNSTLKNYVVTAQRLEQQQELLKRQILRMLLNGTYLLDVQQYLDKMNIVIPGPFFFVMSILLPSHAVKDEVLTMLQKEVEELTSADVNEYLYVVCDQEQKQLWVICSFTDSGKEREIIEYVTETVESFIEGIRVGVGRVCGSLGKISVSWLESMDDLSGKNFQKSGGSQEFTYNAESLQCIIEALLSGNKEKALLELGNYTSYLKENQLSLLMCQYIYTEFIGGISRISKQYKVKLSNRNLSLIVASKSVESFYEAAYTLICEFCENYAVIMENKIKEGSEVVCKYLKEHCMEYDLSVEKAASELGMTNTIVRDSVYEATGKNFRNYVVFLRVEYAKKLLIEEKLPVHEVGQRVGESSVTPFIKIFKEETGQTPAKYVKENMKVYSKQEKDGI